MHAFQVKEMKGIESKNKCFSPPIDKVSRIGRLNLNQRELIQTLSATKYKFSGLVGDSKPSI